ncbi:MAG: RluA family pseudouridine synthase [Acholeplasmatales bacterium]|nr:RluA family pseudouridine synthase [Acholeplasmatales bacterium]
MKVKLNNESINSFLDRMHLSKKKIYELKTNKKITGEFKDYDEVLNSIVDFNLDEELNYNPEEGNLDIIYEDDNYLAVNKKRGIIIHDESNSLANIVAHYYKEKNIKSWVRYPSRLDKDTTGVVIFPKNMIIASYMDYLFSNDLVDKIYVALAHNRFKDNSGKITYSISTDRHNNNKMVTTINGKKCKTNYKVIKNGEVSYLELRIKNGRTHQIRVHLEKIGHSILGDSIYGDGIGNLMLHCKKIEFNNIDGKKLTFEAKLDKDFETKLKEIGAI